MSILAALPNMRPKTLADFLCAVGDRSELFLFEYFCRSMLKSHEKFKAFLKTVAEICELRPDKMKVLCLSNTVSFPRIRADHLMADNNVVICPVQLKCCAHCGADYTSYLK